MPSKEQSQVYEIQCRKWNFLHCYLWTDHFKSLRFFTNNENWCEGQHISTLAFPMMQLLKMVFTLARSCYPSWPFVKCQSLGCPLTRHFEMHIIYRSNKRAAWMVCLWWSLKHGKISSMGVMINTKSTKFCDFDTADRDMNSGTNAIDVSIAGISVNNLFRLCLL